MMRLITILIVTILSCTISYAKDNTPPIAVLNLEFVYSEAEVTKNLNQQIRQIQEKYYKQDEAKQKQLKNKQEELIKLKSTLSEGEFDKKVEKFEQDVEMYNVEKNQYQNHISEALAKVEKKLQNTLLTVTADVAKTKQYGIVLNSSAIVYNNDTTHNDITNDIIKALNAKLKTIDLEVKNK